MFAPLRMLATGAATASAMLGLSGARHPMHTAVTEITCERPCSEAAISIRVFADDFGAVVAGTPGSAAADSAASRYVRAHLTMLDDRGSALEARWSAARRDGDVILLHLRAPAAAACPGARIRSTLLADRFPDQINIVRARCGARPVTLLFTPGDAAQAL